MVGSCATKKFVTILVMAVMLVLALGTSSMAAEEFNWKKYSGTTITVALNKHPFTESLIPLIPEFTKQTGISIAYLILPEEEFFQKVLFDLSTKAGQFDVVMTGPTRSWAYVYPTPPWLEDLMKYVNDPKLTASDYDFKDFFPLLIAANRWNRKLGGGVGEGGLWAIPVMAETYVLAYRKDLLDRFGIKTPVTLPEMYEAAKKLTFKDGGTQIYGVIQRGIRAGSTMSTGYMSAFKSYGASDFNENMKCTVNSPQAIEMTDLWCKMIREAGPPGWTSVTWYEGKEMFAQGSYAMFYDCDFFAASYENPERSKVAGKVAYGLPPRSPNGNHKSRLWTWGLGMSAHSRNKEAAWYFIQWATSKQQFLKATLNYANYNPTRKSVFDNAEVRKVMGSWGGGTYLKAVLENLDKYAEVAFTPNPEVPVLTDKWAQALHYIWGKQKTAKQAMDELAREIDEYMRRAGHVK